MLKLGFLGFVVSFLVPIVVGFVLGDYLDNYFWFLIAFLVVIVSVMGLCGICGSLLHYMLPRKRASEGEVVQEDGENSSVNKSESTSALKKIRIVEAADSTVTYNSDVVCGENNCNSGNNHSSGSLVKEEEEEEEASIMALGNANPTDIDEDLHSRQLAVYGRETMRRLFASNILVSGMQGLGAEIGTYTNIFERLLVILIYLPR